MEVVNQLSRFKDLYFSPINPNLFKNQEDIVQFLILFFYFLLFVIILHTLIIYLAANLRNSYPYFRMILISTIYSFSVSFFLGKIFQSFFEVVNVMPLVGKDLLFLGVYGNITIVYIFEVLLVNNRLKALYERRFLDSEPIGVDIFIGMTVATLAGIIIFSLVP